MGVVCSDDVRIAFEHQDVYGSTRGNKMTVKESKNCVLAASLLTVPCTLDRYLQIARVRGKQGATGTARPPICAFLGASISILS